MISEVRKAVVIKEVFQEASNAIAATQEMRERLLFLLLTLFLCSCNGQFLSSQTIPYRDALSYCSLLHVPSWPYPVSQPRPYLGVFLEAQRAEASFPVCKESIFVKVAGIIEGTPAAEAGMKEGDVIIAENRNPTCRDGGDILESFRKKIRQQAIGSVMTLDVMRGGQRLSLDVKLTEVPTRYRPEATHTDTGLCSGEIPSLLDASFRSQNVFPEFRSVVDGLYERSNIVDNPGKAHDDRFDSLYLKEMTYMMRHPLHTGEVARELSQRLVTPLLKRDWHLMGVIQEAARLLDGEASLSDSHGDITFPQLLAAMGEARKRVDAALGLLTPEERARLQEKALHPWDDVEWNALLDSSLKISRKDVIEAFAPILSFLTRENLSLLREDLLKRFRSAEGPILYEGTTPLGKVVVGGAGPNVYVEDAALILDIGGDDLYLNNAGGSRPGMPVALVIDWGGNDRYIARDNFSQGAGVLGGGFLVDLGGNDTFVSLDGGQGAGFLGLGIVYHGSGNAVYNARGFSQGVGQMGIGLIFNADGRDLYHCSHDGQALGLFGGVGMLIDGAGNDYYQLGGTQPDFRDPLRSTVSMGQGFGRGIRPEKEARGVPGGIGVLIDGAGDDVYMADYFAQGSAYYYGVGILNDFSGSDEYVAGRYAQGSGIHSAVGCFIDQTGDDSYYVSFGVAQGMGHDFGVGYFEDSKGNDRYWGGTLVQGAATRGGIGIFVDAYGRDSFSSSGKGRGYAEDEECMGIFIGTESGSELLRNECERQVDVRLGLKRTLKE